MGASFADGRSAQHPARDAALLTPLARTQGLAPDGRAILAGRARLTALVRPCEVYRRDDGGIVGVPNLEARGIRLRRPSNG
jgi:hypothetical protein